MRKHNPWTIVAAEMIRASLIAQGKRSLVMSLLLAVLVFFIYLYLDYRGLVKGWILTAGWGLVILNLLRAGLGLAYHLRRHPFRRFELGLRDDRVQPGGAFHLELVIESRRPVVLRCLTARLRCLSQIAKEGGREDALIHALQRVVVQDLGLESGTGRRYEVELPVPADAPFSYKDFQGHITWTVAVTADVTEWGVLSDEFNVTVFPG